MTTAQLIEDLKIDEGLRLNAYKDTMGIWTVGYGHAHVAPNTVWTEDEAIKHLELDIQVAELSLDRTLPWWRQLDDRRQDALCNMCFNMGIKTLLAFSTFLQFMKTKMYPQAALDLRGTVWHSEVGSRAKRVEAIIRTGK